VKTCWPDYGRSNATRWGSLAQPLTFLENQANPLAACWWTVTLTREDRSWASPDGYKMQLPLNLVGAVAGGAACPGTSAGRS